MEKYLLLLAGGFYLLGAGSLFLRAGWRKWIWGSGSILFILILSVIALLPKIYALTNAEALNITNYSSKSGVLYFLEQDSKGAHILYDFAVNKNEEKSFRIESEGGGYDAVLFLSEEKIFEVPIQTQEYRELEVWEKKLKPADASSEQLLNDWQQRQQLYSLAIGLMLFWFLLHLFYLMWEKKRTQKKTPAGKIFNPEKAIIK